MRTSLACCLTLLLASAAAARPQTPDTFLDAARQKYPAGPRSFAVRVTLVEHSADATFDYKWDGKSGERFDFGELPAATKKSLKAGFAGLWRDLCSGRFLAGLRRASDLRLEAGKERVLLHARDAELGNLRATFEPRSYRLLALTLPDHGVDLWFGVTDAGSRLQLRSRKVRLMGARKMTITYGTFRLVNGHELPTRLTVVGTRETLEFTLAFRRVEGKPARVETLGEQTIRERVRRFEREWRRWEVTRKQEQLSQMAELDSDLASAAIARRGLRDGSAALRKQAASLLARMKRTNVTPQLVAALEANRGSQEVYVTVCLALGELNDPRAVRPLSKNWWQHRQAGARGLIARIVAVGRIRHASSVDALLSLITVTHKDKIGPYARYVHASLVNLTRQDFGYDGRAWRKWWDANRAGFRFK